MQKLEGSYFNIATSQNVIFTDLSSRNSQNYNCFYNDPDSYEVMLICEFVFKAVLFLFFSEVNKKKDCDLLSYWLAYNCNFG